MSLARTLATQRLVIVLGTGGVGKTTLAAAAALAAAREGRRVALVTIDPARRLADALGLDTLGDAPTRVALGGAVFDALMLSPERTFDRLVGRFAGSDTARQRILDNPIYRHLSRSLAGSAEYAAMERVHELLSDDRYELVVVDTPPAQHALDFLEAPQRLLWLFDSSVLRHLLHPAFVAGRFGLQVFQRASARVFQVLERITGVGFLEDVSEFLLAFEGISGPLQRHAEEVKASLRDAAMLVVAAPTAASARAAGRFWDHLRDASAPPAGLVWNRVHPMADASHPPDPERVRRCLAGGVANLEGELQRASEAARRYVVRAVAETRATAALSDRAEAEGGFVVRVPELLIDLHEGGGIEHLAGLLGGAAPSRLG